MCLLAEVFPLTFTVREQTSKSAKTIYWNSLWQPNVTIRIRRGPREKSLAAVFRIPFEKFVGKLFKGDPLQRTTWIRSSWPGKVAG